MNDRAISVARKMKIARNSIDLEESFHSAASLSVNIFDNLVEFVLIRHMVVFVLHLFGQTDFFEVIHDIHQVNFKDILDIEGEEGAWISSELNIDMDLQFLSQMLLVNY